jgi:hypothetical protein
MTMAPAPSAARASALGGHLLDHAGHHHLQAAACRRRGDVDVGAGVALLRLLDQEVVLAGGLVAQEAAAA